MQLPAAAAAAAPLRPAKSAHFLRPPKTLTLTLAGSLACSLSSPPPPPPPPPTDDLPPMPKRIRYRKQFPGEAVGVVEEMRFVAMRLRKRKTTPSSSSSDDGGDGGEEKGEGAAEEEVEDVKEGEGDGEGREWMPSMEGFVMYLVDSKLVFDTVERIVSESTHVSYVCFRKTGLERSASITKDLEWFKQQDIVIPEPSTPGSTYAAYLTQLAESSVPAFLSHFYNIYFAHTTGGLAIGRKVSEKILDGRELELYKWDTDVELLLTGVRDKLNKLSQHWSRKDRSECLKEAKKSFQFLGRIVRLIIL